MTSSETPPLSPQSSYPTLVGVIGIYIYISEVGGLRPTGKSFRFVRACAAVRKVRTDLKNDPDPFSLFPFGGVCFPFSSVRSGVPFPLR